MKPFRHKMRPDIEVQIKKMVIATTSVAAIEEWKDASENQNVPLYNYRGDHVEQVVNLAKHLASKIDADIEVVSLAAWFHDFAKPGLGGVAIRDHGVASAELAKDWLLKNGFEELLIRKVCDVIKKHVGLTLEAPLSPIEAQILWEADKIHKLGLVGLLQYILNGIRIYPGNSLLEFHTKLVEFLPLAEKIARSVVTERGKELAIERLETLQNLTRILGSELSSDS
ncbi:MAG: HD domain-containing protein [Candidatus Thorarchaeota archaeon]|nr:HD domain-containing protein [Candidatus Thorarchaeota archaeon]